MVPTNNFQKLSQQGHRLFLHFHLMLWRWYRPAYCTGISSAMHSRNVANMFWIHIPVCFLEEVPWYRFWLRFSRKYSSLMILFIFQLFQASNSQYCQETSHDNIYFTFILYDHSPLTIDTRQMCFHRYTALWYTAVYDVCHMQDTCLLARILFGACYFFSLSSCRIEAHATSTGFIKYLLGTFCRECDRDVIFLDTPLIFFAVCRVGCVCSADSFMLWWFKVYICNLSYYHHQIGSMKFSHSFHTCVCVRLTRSCLGDPKNIFVTYPIIIIKSGVWTFPTVFIFVHGCVFQVDVPSYYLNCFI